MEIQKLKEVEDLVNEHQREIIGFHYRFVGNLADAEDLAQETFIKAYKKIHTLKDHKKAKSWLYSIARNTVIDFFRKNKNKEIALSDALLESVAKTTATEYQEKAISSEITKELDRCIDRLVKEDRAIVRLLYYEGFSYKEIAGLLNINENTLKSRLHRARSVLLEMIRTSKPLGDVALQYESRTK
ncbi:MAG: RNA polymerase sigma factor [Patescibacteria group bacterium]